MAFFKIPSLNTFPKQKRNNTLQVFDHAKAEKIEKLGEGTFGSAVLVRYEGSYAVVKDLKCEEWDESGRKFLKEVNLAAKTAR